MLESIGYNKNRAHYNNNALHPMAGSKEAQRNRQYYGADGGILELADSAGASRNLELGQFQALVSAAMLTALLYFLL